MPSRRSGLTCCVFGGRVYALGGYDGKNFLNAVESLDVATGEWRIETPMPTKRSGLAAVVVRDRIYCLGGYDGRSFLSTVESFDPRTGEWHAARGRSHRPRQTGAGGAHNFSTLVNSG